MHVFGVKISMSKSYGDSNEVKCALCGKVLSTGSKGHGKPEQMVINGTHYFFDSKDCSTMFKRFWSVYGTKFNEILAQENSVSNSLWNKVIPREKEIAEIESGDLESDILQTIKDFRTVHRLSRDLLRSANEQILMMFSTPKSFHIDYLTGETPLSDIIHSKSNIQVRIITPNDEVVNEFTSRPTKNRQTKTIEIRHILEALNTNITVFVVDRKYSLAIEMADNKGVNPYENLRTATYSNSKATAIMYISIFESLWKQVDLIEQITNLTEKLRADKKVHNEFISIAAHELRSPVQPILGLAQLLRSRKEIGFREQDELLTVIIRNAKRLMELTENILDVTRIDDQTLHLRKQPICIDELIANAVEDIRNQLDPKQKIILIHENPKKEFPLIAEADRGRLAQVISNLISNAVKFTTEGTITVTAERRDRNLIVRVKDTGTGIASDIMPRLFEKFVTTSEGGIGLGLFVSKSIIGAHGGTIWADNNLGERGATFSFAIPIGISPEII
jgi:two-component system, OmpR family, sensor histidine kinase VicK